MACRGNRASAISIDLSSSLHSQGKPAALAQIRCEWSISCVEVLRSASLALFVHALL